MENPRRYHRDISVARGARTFNVGVSAALDSSMRIYTRYMIWRITRGTHTIVVTLKLNSTYYVILMCELYIY